MVEIAKLAKISLDLSNQSNWTSLNIGIGLSYSDCIGKSIGWFEVD
jgi:hypothetical protein